MSRHYLHKRKTLMLILILTTIASTCTWTNDRQNDDLYANTIELPTRKISHKNNQQSLVVPPIQRSFFEVTKNIFSPIAATSDLNSAVGPLTHLPPQKSFESEMPEAQMPIDQVIEPTAQLVYIGRYEGEGESVVFLNLNSRNYAVHEGEKIDNLYQVLEVSSKALTVIHLPTNLQQSIPLGVDN